MAAGDVLSFSMAHVVLIGANNSVRFFYRLTGPVDPELGDMSDTRPRAVSRDMPLTGAQQTTLNSFITTKTADLKALSAVGAAAVVLRWNIDPDGTGSWVVSVFYTLVQSTITVYHKRIITLTAAQRTTLNTFMATKLADLAAIEAV